MKNLEVSETDNLDIVEIITPAIINIMIATTIPTLLFDTT